MNIQGLPSQLAQPTEMESSKSKGNFGALLKQYTAEVMVLAMLLRQCWR